MLINTAQSNTDFQLKSGSEICIIGGGPAGSFFCIFLFELAQRLGLDIKVDIIEAKDFSCLGAAGCNHCGGIISESLVQLLAAEGIKLPSNVIRRGINSYVMHVEDRNVKIETPLHEKRIASVFRGSGPRAKEATGYDSFDKFLLDLCIQKGANVIFDKVEEISYSNFLPVIKTKNKFEKSYELIVAAVGLDSRSLKVLNGANPQFTPPGTTKTHISEFFLGEELVSKHFGDSMHVFLLDIPNLEFGALIPKGNYVTMVLLGNEIDKTLVESFLKSEQVVKCFPDGWEILKMSKCQCYPKINLKPAKYMYGDRFVAIGDSATSKLYKNGIGAAYITAKAAATTVLFDGVSANDFSKNYMRACNTLNYDNSIGKIVFFVTKIIKQSSILKRGVVKTIIQEQKKSGNHRHMSTVLWDTFTGSASYKEIFMRTLHPNFLFPFMWNILLSLKNKTN